MSPDHADDPHTVAVDQLQALGLSAYAARTFVALLSLQRGTAQEVSDVSEVPRTRVYDAVEELRERGLVDVQQSTPKEFWAISPTTAGRQFEQEYSNRVESLTDALDSVAPRERQTEQRGVLTVTGRETVTSRVVDLVESAEEEIVFMSVEGLLDDRIVEEVQAANDRGVSIMFASMSSSAETRLEDAVPDFQSFESLWDWSDTPAGRLLMVDRKRTLVSVLVQHAEDQRSDSREETAIWASGETNSLVVVLKALFAWQLDEMSD